jgi:hypothetical protein
MGFFDREVINLTKGVETKVGENTKGDHLVKVAK